MTVRMGRKLCELSASIIDDRLNRDWLECIKTAGNTGHPSGQPRACFCGA